MTDQDRTAAIRARVEKATPEPWHAPGLGEVHSDHERGVFVQIVTDFDGELHETPVVADGCTEADAEFITHAREDIPYLLAENQRLREELAECRSTRPRKEQP